MSEKWVARVTIEGASKMSPSQRLKLAYWLESVGRSLVELGHAMAPRFRARYQFPAKKKDKA